MDSDFTGKSSDESLASVCVWPGHQTAETDRIVKVERRVVLGMGGD